MARLLLERGQRVETCRPRGGSQTRALGTLAAARGFTALAVATLGIGLALALSVLSVVHAYAIRSLPYPEADRLHRVDYAAPGQAAPRGLEQLDWAALDDVIELAIAWDLDVFYLLGGEYPDAAPGAWVTPGYLRGFGVRPLLGRLFEGSDYHASSPAVAMISHRLWQTRFDGDPGVLGRSFQAYVSDRPEEPETFTVVGVLPPDLWHLNAYTEVLAPLVAGAAVAFAICGLLAIGWPAWRAAATDPALVLKDQ